ncbi:hypothetical protein Belba_2051 [Belliella baltica DSM 15883]|uniref:Uncharacterized protein n=1 Tax=Belliella baltica (strain DSM 15883 / CIP 108006 / LMG 21964 / BA134) TaxID=866536 RepID=I3Z5V6_BELBD|nr:hypothetical protein Belba_2051 [Belliella baltica DSM 15883]
MDIFNMLIGILLILISIIIFIIQIRDKAYKRDDFNMGNVNIYYAGIVAFLAGMYFFFTSF